MAVNTFRDLLVWQKGKNFVTLVYRITATFPQTELYGLSSQMRRAAVSIPSNIAEGFARQSRKDFQQFLRISRGSLFELQTQIEISFELEYIQSDQLQNLIALSSEIERMLASLIKSLDRPKSAGISTK